MCAQLARLRHEAGVPLESPDAAGPRRLAEAGVGWDLPLDRPDLFREALAACVAMDAAAHAAMSSRARDFALRAGAVEDAVEASRRLFRTALGVPEERT